MSITRSQIARELMAEGGAPRQSRAYGGVMGNDGRKAYFLGSFFQKYVKDPIERSIRGVDQSVLDKESQARVDRQEALYGKGNTQPIERMLFGKKTPVDSKGEPIEGGDTTTKRVGGILGPLLSPAGLSIGAGLLAGAFAKDKDDPLYTGQSVGLNLRDIRKLANISDQKTGAAIGLNFLPETRFRQFTPEQMAETYATTTPVDFTEQRESADEGGLMGNQEDFNKFLEEMKKRDMGRMQEQILRDYEEYMRRKKMINQMPEVKDGGRIMANKGGIMGQFKMASAPDPAAERNSFLEMMSERFYGKPLKDLTPDEFMDLEEALDDMGMKPRDNNMKMASAVLGDESDDIAQELFGKRFKDLNPAELEEFFMHLDNLEKKFMKRDFKKNRTMVAGGGLMNLGGMEMDLRGGGFVPIGAKEKADDVPARLSKNEFVFTADAVRAAGGGSVDKGADKMYATMKALENKVA